MLKLDVLKTVLKKCYSKELCYKKDLERWSIDRCEIGMCSITSILVQEYFGGDIGKIKTNYGSHYFNVIGEEIIDLTKEQFDFELDYSNKIIIKRINILDEDTSKRLNILKNRVIEELLNGVDEDIHKCQKCQGLVEKFPDDKTYYLGDNQDILLVGEAPANNGWRKSHMLWRDINGKMLPSGNVLQKLFAILDRDILNTSFIEAVKCYPIMRNNLKIAIPHCMNYTLRQIEIINPKIIICLGEAPTRILLDFKFKKFSDVVGKLFDINGYKILPIYHPSPISPKSYNGNLPIFEELKRTIENL